MLIEKLQKFKLSKLIKYLDFIVKVFGSWYFKTTLECNLDEALIDGVELIETPNVICCEFLHD